MRIESLADGRRMLQAGELLRPGELELEPGEYQSPPFSSVTAVRDKTG